MQLDLISQIEPASGPVQKKTDIREIVMTAPRFALAFAATVLATSILATQCLAQDYPTRPVKIIVPFGAGGPADVTARLIGSIMQEKLGQAFVIGKRTRDAAP